MKTSFLKKLRPFLLILILLLTAGLASAQTTLTETFTYDGHLRSYNIYLPANYVSNSVRPLIIHFHGYSANASLDQNLTQWMPVADTAGFLVAYPNGLTDNLGNQYWNVGWPWLPNTDDVAFVSVLIDTLHSRYNIDMNSVYATGFSAGGFMSHLLAAKLSTRITACASVSGGMAPGVFDTIVPQRPVPIIEMHGTADGLVPYDGNTGQFASVNTDSLIHFWAVNN
ncbi:MAG: PHB depolymerase family esterase, partial [Chitinophagales bacterium]